ncbi:MAG: hypothetical protein FWH46_04530 [Methanimicrococcus sp.]|nr:hypothetical protein [Methanimicrococcus sp.]
METAMIEEHKKVLRDYLENVVKKETPEESKKILIETGVLDQDGKKIIRHGIEW